MISKTGTNWESPPPHLSLKANDLHVWRLPFPELTGWVEDAAVILSEDEQSKAERFRFEKDRTQSILSRGALRTLLSRYLGVDPAAVHFKYSPADKPELADPVPHLGHPFSFNLSHSGDFALIAIAGLPVVGIDVESIRPDFATAETAARFFSPLEVRLLFSLPVQDQSAAFFECWSRKEAYIKAVGDGLSIPLDSFDVEFRPGEPARVLAVRGNTEASSWWMGAIDVHEGYAAAVVCSAEPLRIAYFDFPKMPR